LSLLLLELLLELSLLLLELSLLLLELSLLLLELPPLELELSLLLALPPYPLLNCSNQRQRDHKLRLALNP